MPCYYPIDVEYCPPSIVSGTDGIVRFNAHLEECNLKLPCGQCIGCRDRRARDWALRCMHEASLYSRNCFITLTYNAEHLPVFGESKVPTLFYPDFQQFMKRLLEARKGVDEVKHPKFGQFDKKHNRFYPEFYRPIRFYMCGEYGSDFGRPHFHALLFNFDFDDKYVFKRTPAGELIYRSPFLESLWPNGYSSIGELTFNSAAYVARYIDSKVTGDAADDHYAWVDPATGEVFWRQPEFNRMSLKPGLGSGWYDKFSGDVFPHDYVISNGKKLPVPRYYFKLYKCTNPFDSDAVSHERYEKSRLLLDDNSKERLDVRRRVHLIRKSRLKRVLS